MDKSTNRILIQNISDPEILEISDQESQQVCGGLLGTLLGLTPPSPTQPIVIIDGEVQQPEPLEPAEVPPPTGLLGLLSSLGLGLI
ncbi:hypothetical protein F7734_33090 [Scytonema sp. UIC 10036]|uniref:hypothetical protein n=1 Tax=Scytonema sp. UIC 10036 TaxID=2304196 RepID=UPI0012DAF6CD|nr:hypothetical protein [Scytonema sp. UIC 10036]MUG96919.1 hypothetical protein [Scytonema sp. UIC 10036]